MRKIDITCLRLPAVIAVIAMLISVTGSCRRSHSRDNDTVGVDSAAVSIPYGSLADTTLIMTAEGIGQVKCGIPLSDLAPALDGVYDSIETWSEAEFDIYSFIFEGEERFEGFDFGDGVLSVLSARSTDIVVETPDGVITRDIPFTRVLSLPSVTAEFESGNYGGIWCWKWHGLYFLPDDQHIPERLVSKLYNGDTEPVSEDFDDTVKLYYIGTGLPF
ncbi:MAG: hypothetical protein K2H86_05715 [Muribaculaceae bacterium]|nr:hypothetical protein [Muribaculaceae bacterium]